MKQSCYLCQLGKADKAPFDPSVHCICVSCRDKLLALAQNDVSFTRRKQPVFITTRKPPEPVTTPVTLKLTTGEQVVLEDETTPESLFKAIGKVVAKQVKGIDDSSLTGLAVAAELCLMELYFIAGQLHHMGSDIDYKMLLDAFGDHGHDVLWGGQGSGAAWRPSGLPVA